MNVQKVLGVSLMLSGVAFLAGCVLSNPQGTGTVVPQESTPAVTVQSIFPLSYTNPDYTFKLRFPATWEGYTVGKRGLFAGEGQKDIDSYDFLHGGEVIFNVSVHPKASWEAMLQEEGPKPIYLGENKEYVFGHTYAQDGSFEASKRWNEVPLIVKTFEVK